jgi:hypothetical protein
MITIARAVKLAYDWHGGGGSALYQFASCNGTIHSEDHRAKLSHEIRDARRTTRTRTESKELDALLRHVESRKVNKEYEIQGDYGYGNGHECLTTEYNRLSAHNQLRNYRANDRAVKSLRIRVKRVKIAAE